MTDNFHAVFNFLLILQAIQTVICLFLTFGPLLLGKSNPCSCICGRKLAYILVKLCFVVLPILTIVVVVWQTIVGTIALPFRETQQTEDVFAVWPIFCALINVFVLIYYFTFILEEIVQAIAEEPQDNDEDQKKEETAGEDQEKEETAGEDPTRFHYDFRGKNGEKYYRDPGTGPYRIGRTIKVRPDLYSMLFVSSMRPEYIFHIKCLEEKKQASLLELSERGQAKKQDESATQPVEFDSAINLTEAMPNEMQTDQEDVEPEKEQQTPEEVAFTKLSYRLSYDGNNYLSQTFAIWCFQIGLVIFII